MTTIGFLRVGQYFMLDGRKYRVGHLIDGTNGYVACTDITDEKRKVKRFYIDTSVEEIKWGRYDNTWINRQRNRA